MGDRGNKGTPSQRGSAIVKSSPGQEQSKDRIPFSGEHQGGPVAKHGELPILVHHGPGYAGGHGMNLVDVHQTD